MSIICTSERLELTDYAIALRDKVLKVTTILQQSQNTKVISQLQKNIILVIMYMSKYIIISLKQICFLIMMMIYIYKV
ncbi:MAG: hypothetical protein WC008_04390 [Bacilli bacterium]